MKNPGGGGGITLNIMRDVKRNIMSMGNKKQKQDASRNEYSKNKKELLEIKTRIAKVFKSYSIDEKVLHLISLQGNAN